MSDARHDDRSDADVIDVRRSKIFVFGSGSVWMDFAQDLQTTLLSLGFSPTFDVQPVGRAIRVVTTSLHGDSAVDLVAIGPESEPGRTAVALLNPQAVDELAVAAERAVITAGRQATLFGAGRPPLQRDVDVIPHFLASVRRWLHSEVPEPDGIDRLATAFASGLRGLDQLPGREPGSPISDEMLEEARQAGERFVAAQRWAQLTGDRVDTATLRKGLGISRQALNQRVAAGTVLAVPGTSTNWYPTWQFRTVEGSDRLEVRPVVGLILQQFRDQLGDQLRPLTVVSWAATGQPELDGSSPRDWISNDKSDEPVVASAVRAAAQLAR